MLTRTLPIVCCVVSAWAFAAGAATAQLKITSPFANSAVSGEVIEVKGTGADPKGTLKVEVLTNKWWLQDGETRINSDGSWSYGPCYLSGQGQFNNHTIRVTVIKNGQAVSSDSVAGIRRQ